MRRPIRSRWQRALPILVAAALAAPLVATEPAAAACPTLGPTDDWIGGYTINGSSGSFFAEGVLRSDGAGVVTGEVTSLNGAPPNPNHIQGGLLVCDQLSGRTIGLLASPIDWTATLRENGNEIYDGFWTVPGTSVGGTFSSARVVREFSQTSTTITSDQGTGATPALPLQVSVTSPTSGALELQLGSSQYGVLGQYQLLNQVVHVSAPPATAGAPLELQFVLDSSTLLGVPAGGVAVLRHGTAVANCSATAGTAASPDPCVLNRSPVAGGDAQITVRTSQASIWSFGVSSNSLGFRVTRVGLPGGRLGQSYNATLSAAGGTVPYKWKKLVKLPKGLKLKAKTGVISGKPKVAGTFVVPVQVRDKARPKRIALKTFTIVVT